MNKQAEDQNVEWEEDSEVRCVHFGLFNTADFIQLSSMLIFFLKNRGFLMEYMQQDAPCAKSDKFRFNC